MPLLFAETFPLLPPAAPAATSGRTRILRHESAPAALPLQPARDANDVPDQSYWMAYDHYMIEREAQAMRREYVWALLAKAWSGLWR